MTTQTRIDIGTSQLGYRTVGDGPDIVFVHGWPLNKETWRNVVPHLPGFRSHLIDLPGSGDSITPAETPVSLRGSIDAVAAAVDELGLEQFVLAGHDSGGLIARFVAEKVIDRVQALILTGTEIPHHHPKIIDRLQKLTKLPGSLALTSRLLGIPKVARSNQLLGGLFHDRDLIEGDFRAEVLDQHLSSPSIMARQFELLASYSTDFVDEVEAIHHKLTCPTLFVWGETDPFFPVKHAREMTTQFAGPTRFEVVANARLLVHEEHPEQFAQLCAEFLA